MLNEMLMILSPELAQKKIYEAFVLGEISNSKKRNLLRNVTNLTNKP